MENEKEYSFYFDESFHDRKITSNEKTGLNIYEADKSDIFVGAFIGFEKEKIRMVEEDYEKFEKKYKKFYDITENGELKGATISKKNFQSGFAKMNLNTIKFYNDYFDVLLEHKCIFQLNLFSKIEHIICNAIAVSNFGVIGEEYRLPFLYSVIKFIDNYKYLGISKNLIAQKKKLTSQQIIMHIKKKIIEVQKQIKDIKRKEQEYKALNGILQILKLIYIEIKQEEKVDWDYSLSFSGINELIREMQLNNKNIELEIDREERNFKTGKNICNFKSFKQVDSKESFGIRIADVFSNFWGRLIYSLRYELQEDYKNGINSDRKLISPRWFHLREDQFLLAKKIKNLIDVDYSSSSYGGIYMDYPVIALSYIKYIAQYKDFDEYKNIEIKHHTEEGNKNLMEILRGNIENLNHLNPKLSNLEN